MKHLHHRSNLERACTFVLEKKRKGKPRGEDIKNTNALSFHAQRVGAMCDSGVQAERVSASGTYVHTTPPQHKPKRGCRSYLRWIEASQPRLPSNPMPAGRRFCFKNSSPKKKEKNLAKTRTRRAPDPYCSTRDTLVTSSTTGTVA